MLINALLDLINDIINITGYVLYMMIKAAQVFCLLTADAFDISCCLKEEGVCWKKVVFYYLCTTSMFPNSTFYLLLFFIQQNLFFTKLNLRLL